MKTASAGHLTWHINARALTEPLLRNPLTAISRFDTPCGSSHRRHDDRTGACQNPESLFDPQEPGEWLHQPVVLVPVDFSAASRYAVQVGVSVARHTQAKLILCHAIFPKVISFGPAAQPWVGEALRDEATEEMRPMMEVARDAGLEPTGIVEEGTPAGLILNAAARHEADLIILAPREHSLWARLLFGPETSEQIIREAQCPVMVIRNAP